MRKLLLLCVITLFFTVAAKAQNSPATLSASSTTSASPAPQRLGSVNAYPWELGVSYQFIRFKILGTTMNLHGFNTSATRFFGDWFGLEGDVSGGFGNTGVTPAFPISQTAKLVFFGGGPRIAIRHYDRIEPWAHALVGGVHFNPQTAFGGKNALGFQGGIGMDFRLAPRLSWRVQGDYLGTRYFSSWQHNWKAGTGFVINF